MPIGDAVNSEVACVTTFMCHEDEETALARGIAGANFFGYSLAHYYVFGRHQPGVTDVWAEYEQRRTEQGFDPEAVAAAAVDEGRLGAKIVDEGTAGLRGAVGTPDQVREYLRRYEEAGVDQVIFTAQAGKNRHEHIMESLELFGREVLPEFADREPAAAEQRAKRTQRMTDTPHAAQAGVGPPAAPRARLLVPGDPAPHGRPLRIRRLPRLARPVRRAVGGGRRPDPRPHRLIVASAPPAPPALPGGAGHLVHVREHQVDVVDGERVAGVGDQSHGRTRDQRPGAARELVRVERFGSFADDHCDGCRDRTELVVGEREQPGDPGWVVDLAVERESDRALVLEEWHVESLRQSKPRAFGRVRTEQDGNPPEHEAQHVQRSDADRIEQDRSRDACGPTCQQIEGEPTTEGMTDERRGPKVQRRECALELGAEVVGFDVGRSLHAATGVSDDVDRPDVLSRQLLGVGRPEQRGTADAVEEDDRVARARPPVGAGRPVRRLDIDRLRPTGVLRPELVLDRPESSPPPPGCAIGTSTTSVSWYGCTMKLVPKRVDHGERRREITDAVVRITLKGGLTAATFREVADEAGVSVRLVQYYFGTKDELLLATQRHVAERSILRLRAWVADTDGSPRAWLGAFMGSFVPTDDESRAAMLMYVALHTESLMHPELARTEAFEVPRTMHRTIADQLRRGQPAHAVDVDLEASLLTALVPAVGQSVLDGSMRPERALELIDYALARALP